MIACLREAASSHASATRVSKVAHPDSVPKQTNIIDKSQISLSNNSTIGDPKQTHLVLYKRKSSLTRSLKSTRMLAV